ARLAIDTWRWAGMPFYIRAGKRLPVTDTEVLVEFRRPPLELFGELIPAPPPAPAPRPRRPHRARPAGQAPRRPAHRRGRGAGGGQLPDRRPATLRAPAPRRP